MVWQGYDELSYRYRGDADAPPRYDAWARQLAAKIPPNGNVLDLGCGCGVPMSRDLASAGYAVTGVDASEVQLARARQLVPAGTFVHADMTTVVLAESSFDAVVCLYSIIHVPLDHQPGVLSNVARWLRPGGWLLATTGHEAWTGVDPGWLGSTTSMWWAQADEATYAGWMRAAGLEIGEQRFIQDDGSGHTLFWAQRP